MWVAALKSKVTLLSIIVALFALWVLGCSLGGWGALNILISLVFGASIGEMAILSTIETYCVCFSWRRTFFVVGCCLFDCTYLLRLANIILGVTLPLSWWWSYFHRLHQLIDVLHLHRDSLYSRRSWAWTINICSSVEEGFSMSLLSPLLELRLPSFTVWIIEVDGKIRWGQRWVID
jgi:hypothetical protein